MPPRQIKYDPISRFAPRNNAIDLPFPYRRCHATRRTDNLREEGEEGEFIEMDRARGGDGTMKKLKAGGAGGGGGRCDEEGRPGT